MVLACQRANDKDKCSSSVKHTHACTALERWEREKERKKERKEISQQQEGGIGVKARKESTICKHGFASGFALFAFQLFVLSCLAWSYVMYTHYFPIHLLLIVAMARTSHGWLFKFAPCDLQQNLVEGSKPFDFGCCLLCSELILGGEEKRKRIILCC